MNKPSIAKEIQIPIGDFAYLNVKIAPGEALTHEEAQQAVSDAKLLKEAYTTNKVGLIQKDWNAAVDEYLKTGTLVNGTELFYEMNEKQQFFFQELKKANKRIKID